MYYCKSLVVKEENRELCSVIIISNLLKLWIMLWAIKWHNISLTYQSRVQMKVTEQFLTELRTDFRSFFWISLATLRFWMAFFFEIWATCLKSNIQRLNVLPHDRKQRLDLFSLLLSTVLLYQRGSSRYSISIMCIFY